jgi:hypothetical protein
VHQVVTQRNEMAFVLYSPVPAGVPVHVSGGHLFCCPAGEDEGVFLPDANAGYLEYLTADHCGLARVRKIDSLCAGNPAGPLPDPAAAAFLHDVVRGFAEQRENLTEYLPLQGRLISLDRHQVIPSGLPGDGIRSFPLGMRGVEGDQDCFSLRDCRCVQKGARLSDLVGAIGYPELRDRDSLTVEHRGEQRDLVVLVSPCTAHYLSVDRDFPLAFPAFSGLREEPRAGYHVQLGRFDHGQHPPYR